LVPSPADATPEAVARSFVDALRAESFEQAVKLFDETMAKALPVDKLRSTWVDVRLKYGSIKYVVGARTEEAKGLVAVRLTCSFEKGSLELRVVVDPSTRKVTGFWIKPAEQTASYEPPAYVKPNTFSETAATVGSGEWQLPAALCKPKGIGPFPAVVLVSGSGPHDRDETIGPNLPFRDLGWGLASREIGTLRYEKRTFAHQAKMAARPDEVDIDQEYVEDACAAVALLRQTEAIDPKRIFVLGHSQGGQMLPRIAQRCPEVAGVIGLAASIRPLEEVILEQTEYLLSLQGPLDQAGRAKLDELRQIAARVKDPKLSASTPSKDLMGLPARYWLSMRSYDAGKTAAAIPQPMLWLQGGRDYQVTTTDLELWKKALAGKPRASFKLYPELNHLFIEGTGKSTPAEYEKAGHVTAKVLEDIATWIRKPGG
jgi:dienelactone hydrolase